MKVIVKNVGAETTLQLQAETDLEQHGLQEFVTRLGSDALQVCDTPVRVESIGYGEYPSVDGITFAARRLP